MTESTADVYTREKRNVVVKVWHDLALLSGLFSFF